MRVRLAITWTTWAAINLRSEDWFGAASSALLALGNHTAADAIARGVAKQINICFDADPDTTQVGYRVDFADAEPAGGELDAGFYNSASATRSLCVDYPTTAEMHTMWLRAYDAQPVHIEIAIYFDIPPAA
jgi:hypothetical protein